jgi:hypothetical protein
MGSQGFLPFSQTLQLKQKNMAGEKSKKGETIAHE